MRIFVGLTDVANITATYADGFRALGHEVFSAVWNRSYFYPDAEYDLVIDTRTAGSSGRRGVREFVRMGAHLARLANVLRCDAAILFAPAVLPNHLYLPFLRLLNKKIVSAFWGSDIRYWYAFAEEMRQLGVMEEVAPFIEYARTRLGGSLTDKVRTVRAAEKYSDLILSQPDCGQLQIRPYMRANVPLNLPQYRFHVPARSRPLILHAPSIPEAKGTDVVLKAVRELQQEGVEFDFQLIRKMPNRDLRALLSEADILVDELYSATVGGLSAEGMATGNAVLVRYMEDYCRVPSGCPAINVSTGTLKAALRDAILNVDDRVQRANQGRTYVERANDHLRICAQLLDWMGSVDSLDYDFYPSFYRDFRVPADILDDERKAAGARRLQFFRTLLATGTTKSEKA